MLGFVLFSNGFKVSRWLTTTLSYFPAWEKKPKRSKDVVLQKKHFPPKRASSPATSKTSFLSSVFSRHWKCNTPTKLFHFSTKHFLKINQIQKNKKKKKKLPIPWGKWQPEESQKPALNSEHSHPTSTASLTEVIY